jgi:hypothetical protein
MAWIFVYEQYLHKYSRESFNAHFGLTLEEVMYVYNKYGEETGLSRKEVLLGLHFLWRYPTEFTGAASWKMHRCTYRTKVGLCFYWF